MFRLLVILLVILLAATALNAADWRYPEGMGVVDLSRPPYSADPTGASDSQPAIQRALDEAKGKNAWLLWLPAGTYRLDRGLRWGGPPRMGPSLQGQDRARTVLRLSDRSPDFQDPVKPLGVLTIPGGHADNFSIDIRHLTIDTGKGNAGACGLQYMSNNQGSVRDVTLHSGDGGGVAGLDCAYTDMIGPAWIRDVAIDGFAVGARFAHNVNSLVLEHLTLTDQREVGIDNAGQCLSLHGLVSRNRVPAVRNRDDGFLVMLDARCDGGASGVVAVENQGRLLVRRLTTAGYGTALDDRTGGVVWPGGAVAEHATGGSLRLRPGQIGGLDLPIEEAPEPPWGDPATWADVRAFGARADDKEDDTAAIQRAVDSGAQVVFFPRVDPGQSYRIAGTVEVRGKVRRFVGLRGPWELLSWSGGGDAPAFDVGPKAAASVAWTDFCAWDLEGGSRPFVLHHGPASVLLRGINALLRNSPIYRSGPGAGPAFIEDVCCQFPGAEHSAAGPNLELTAGARVWCRQFNPETLFSPKIRNRGGDLWMLGLKTERGSTLLEAVGGRSELLGGLCYTITPTEGRPMFRLEDASASLSIGEAGWHQRFDLLVEEVVGGAARQLLRGQAPGRSGGAVLPLYLALPAVTGAPSPRVPSRVQAEASGQDAISLRWAAEADPARSGFAVYRDGVRIAETTAASWLDHGLAEDSEHAYEVAAVGRALDEVRASPITGRTAPDRRAPHAVSATLQRSQRTIEVVFDEPVSEASIAKATFATRPETRITARVVRDEHIVVLTLAEVPGTAVAALDLVGVADRAKRANVLPAGSVIVPTIGAEARELWRRAFDTGDDGRVDDNGGWRGGSVVAALVDDGGGKALRVQVKVFSQTMLGVVALEAGKRYRLEARVRGTPTGRPLTLLLRQWDGPYTAYGSVGGELSEGWHRLASEFTVANSDGAVRLFLMFDGDGEIFLDDLRLSVLE